MFAFKTCPAGPIANLSSAIELSVCELWVLKSPLSLKTFVASPWIKRVQNSSLIYSISKSGLAPEAEDICCLEQRYADPANRTTSIFSYCVLSAHSPLWCLPVTSTCHLPEPSGDAPSCESLRQIYK